MKAQDQFYAKADQFLYRILELNPTVATQMGDHRYDGMLGDFTKAGIEGQQREIKTALAAFEAMDVATFDLDGRIDHTLMVQILKSFVRQYECLARHRREPGSYLDEVMGGVFFLIMKDFAPIEERLLSALARMKEAPRVLTEARGNISPLDVPPIWAEIALEQIKQAPGLFMGLLPSIAAGAAPKLEADFKRAGEAAAQAAEAYGEYVERQVAPKAKGDFAVGRRVFDEMLREEHLVDYDADGLLATGHRLFRETEGQMAAVAREINPAKSVTEILEDAKADHPTAEGLLKAYEDAMQASRQFVIDHDIATIPEGETLRIVETPVYARPILPYAAYMPPGILEKRQDGMFLVTPIDPGSPPDLAEQKLKGHNFAKLPVTALHEGYPGHHLQLVWSNRQRTIPRRMGSFLSTLFIEGWAFYCEELMEQLGYISKPVQRLGRLADQLWRAARIVIDASLHTKGMKVDEAVDLLVTKCRLEPTNALAEVRRYTGTPTQPQSYLMGKLAILEIVAAYRKAHPGIALKQLHDDILGCGSLPPKLMRQRLLS
ncbi:MAG TPA: DUF885 domain-containing protein [bacterium]|nr:DUF885 domain-containing protein [bacterium]